MTFVDPRHALRDGFSQWLEELVGSGIRPSRRLDPFSSSMRNIGRTIPWLSDIAQVQAPTAGDQTQAVTDLRSARLVEGSFPSQTLSALGRATLGKWQELGIDRVDPSLEIAQCAALLSEGVRLASPLYTDMMAFWRELVSLRAEDYWTRDLYTLHMPSYLDQADSHGYNPFRVLLVSPDMDIGNEAEWGAWAETSWEGAARLKQLLTKVKSERPGGRLTFCRAMEAHRLSEEDPEALREALTSWGVPDD